MVSVTNEPKLQLVKIVATTKEQERAQAKAAEQEHVIRLSGNAPIEIFSFVTSLHREVVLRHHDGESQDIELTPDEADQVADQLRAAAATARTAKVDG